MTRETNYNASVINAKLEEDWLRMKKKPIFELLVDCDILQVSQNFSANNNIISLPLEPLFPAVKDRSSKKVYLSNQENFFNGWIDLIDKYSSATVITALAKNGITTKWWIELAANAFFNKPLNKSDYYKKQFFLNCCWKARDNYVSQFIDINCEYAINETLIHTHSVEWLERLGEKIDKILPAVLTKITDYTDVLIMLHDYTATDCFGVTFTNRLSAIMKNTTDYFDLQIEIQSLLRMLGYEFTRAKIEKKSTILQCLIDLEHC